MTQNTHSTHSAAFYWILAAISIVILTVLDQITKILAVSHLRNQPDVICIPGVLKLRYLENRGMAFGMLEGKIPVFIILCLLFFCAFFYFYMRVPKQPYYLPLILSSIFMVSGALGNFTDRVFRGYVVDFIYFSLIDFPTFNVADIYVTCGITVMVFLMFFRYKEENDFDFLKPGNRSAR